MNPSPKLVLAFVLTVLTAATVTIHDYWTIRAPEPIVPAWVEPPLPAPGVRSTPLEATCENCDVARSPAENARPEPI